MIYKNVIFLLQKPAVISAPPGTSIGFVDNQCSFLCCGPEIVVLDRGGKVMLKIMQDCGCGTMVFNVSIYKN